MALAGTRPSIGVVVASGLLWLAFGLVINIGVAWTVLLRTGGLIQTAQNPTPSNGLWAHAVPEEWPRRPRFGSTAESFGCSQHRWTTPGDVGFFDMDPQNSYLMIEDQCGWPFRSMTMWRIGVGPTIGKLQELESTGRWTTTLPHFGPAWLPVLPLWPGFALNTLFYALVAWGLWQVPVHLRRRHRRAHNCCPHCGYSLAGLAAGAACPECGDSRAK